MNFRNHIKKVFNNKACFIIYLSLVASCILFAAGPANAQTPDTDRIAQLQKQIEELQKQAEQYRGNIAGERAKAQSLQGEISILNNQINKLQAQISITSKNIDKTEIEIDGLNMNIFDTQQRINYKKDTIGRLILELYKQDNENLLMVLLKNLNISDFFVRTQAAASLNTSLLGLVDELKNDRNDLEMQKIESEEKKKELEDLSKKQREQNTALSQSKLGKNDLLKQTKGQEAAYQKKLAEIERQESLFFTELKELETKIIQGGFYILHVQAHDLPKKGTNIFVWPEDDYRLTQGYGCTSYARCGKARGPYGGSPHNGIDTASGYGSPVKSIGDGEIIANGKNDGFGNWIAIKHPPYDLVSLYGHLSAFEFLRVGTQVKAGQVIGYEGSTGHVTGPHVHLSIYKDFFTYVKEKNGQLYFNYFEGTINPLDYLP